MNGLGPGIQQGSPGYRDSPKVDVELSTRSHAAVGHSKSSHVYGINHHYIHIICAFFQHSQEAKQKIQDLLTQQRVVR